MSLQPCHVSNSRASTEFNEMAEESVSCERVISPEYSGALSLIAKIKRFVCKSQDGVAKLMQPRGYQIMAFAINTFACRPLKISAPI